MGRGVGHPRSQKPTGGEHEGWCFLGEAKLACLAVWARPEGIGWLGREDQQRAHSPWPMSHLGLGPLMAEPPTHCGASSKPWPHLRPQFPHLYDAGLGLLTSQVPTCYQGL